MSKATGGEQVGEAEEGRFQPEVVLEQAMIQEIAVAPDGSSVVFSRRVIEDGKYRKHL